MSLLTRCARTLLHAARPAVARAHGTRGRRRRPAHRARRSIAVVLAGGLAAGAVALGPAIQSSEPAQAALPTVNLGSMRALLPPSALTGRTDSGNSVDCLYRGTGVWAYANQWSRQGHGNVMPENQCKAGEIRQSRVHLTPGTATSATVGTPFVVAAISHRNNPTAYPAGTGSIYISGTARVDIPGVTATLDIPWELHETPDNLYYAACPTDPFNTAKCPDRLSFPAGIERSFSVGPVPYTFRVIHSQIAATGVLNGGFDNGGGTGPPDLLLTENTPCPAPSGTRVLSNVTPEDKVTKICIYAEIVQERTLRVAKQATPQDGTSFPFTSSSDRAGSPWGDQSFSLTSGQSRSQPVQAGETVRIQEGALPAEWVLSSIICRDGTGGTSVGAEYDLATRSVRLAEIPVASSSAALTITCTFLNEKAEPEPQERTLRVLKQTASPADGMSFLFRSSSDRAGSPWGTNQAFWLGAGQSRGPEAVRPGETVEIQELALPTEWELASIVCRNGVGATVPGVVYDLAAGSARLENIPSASSDAAAPITCTFVNQEAAPPQPQERTLTVRKQTASAAGGLSFPFTSSSDRAGSPWATNPAFWLGDGQSVGPRTVMVGETIEIHEGAVPAEWELSSIDCRDGDGVALPGAVYDLASRSVRVEVAAAHSATAAAITCTFLNAEQQPQERTLTVKKQTTAAADDVSFRFTSSSDRAGSPWDTTNSFWLGDGQSLGPRTVVVGETVEIREVSLPEDWVLAAIDCRDGAGIQVPGAVYDEVDRSVRLTIPAAQSAAAIVCTFLNREADPSWTLAKTATIDGAPGDEAMPGDTIVYRVTATGVTGIVTDAMIVDDLSGVRAYATFSYATLRVDGGAPTVVPLVGATLAAGPFTLAAGQTAVLEYRVVVDEDAWLITLENEAFGLGSVPPEDCSADDRSSPDCRTTHRTPSRFWLQKLGYGINGNEPLPVAIDGAVFEVRADDGGAPGDPIDAQPASTGAAGRFDVAGIWPGSYWLSELKAPTGHALLAEPVRFTVAADGTLTVYGTHPNVAVDGSGFEVSIIDTAAYVLPETGGPGTWLFAAGGAAALAIALLAILLRRRRP